MGTVMRKERKVVKYYNDRTSTSGMDILSRYISDLYQGRKEKVAEEINSIPDMELGTITGECFRFIERDDENEKIFLHHMSANELLSMIEINFLTSSSEGERERYLKRWSRDFLIDYHISVTHKSPEGKIDVEEGFIRRCLEVMGGAYIQRVYLHHNAFKLYIMDNYGDWVVSSAV
jgi:hypothetical protein